MEWVKLATPNTGCDNLDGMWEKHHLIVEMWIHASQNKSFLTFQSCYLRLPPGKNKKITTSIIWIRCFVKKKRLIGYQRNIQTKCFFQRARCENGKKWNLARSRSKLELTFFCNISLSNLSRSSYFDPFRNARTGWDTRFNGTGIGW